MATDKLINETQGASMISALGDIADNIQSVGSVSLAKLGMGYAICDVAAATAAKTANLANYTLNEGGLVSIKFTYANTASSATLNINSTGAKAIYYKGAAIADNVIKAGDIALFQYADGVYNLITLDNPFTTAQINALNSGIDSTKVAQIETNKNNISLRPEVLVRSVTSITSTTTLDDTGVSYTIPSNAYVRITATARYGQSNPEEIMIWTGSSVFAHTVAISGDNNFSLTATALIGGITGDTTAKIYARFRGANTNAIILEVESVPNPS